MGSTAEARKLQPEPRAHWVALHEHGIVSTAYGVYRLRKPYADYATFLNYALRCEAYKWEFVTRSKGVWTSRLQLTDDAFLAMPILVPPPDEQAAIVRFLDHAVGRLNRAIAAKRRVVRLLEEQRRAIVHRAVTRGLDPRAPMKDSGVPWLGEVPAGWEVPMLGRCLRNIEQGWSPVAAEGDVADDQWSVLSLSAIRHGTFNPGARKPITRGAAVPDALTVRDGDLLMTRSNTRELVGDVCIASDAPARTIFSDLIYRLNVHHAVIDSVFLRDTLLTNVGRSQIEVAARGASGTMPKLAQGHIRALRIPLPSLPEQKAISAASRSETAPLQETQDRIKHEITLLEEYRTALVSEVVTGKRDVREAAARLPDAPPPAAALDGSLEADPLDFEAGDDDLDEQIEDALA